MTGAATLSTPPETPRPVEARRDGLGIYRLIDPSLTSDETLTTVLQFMSESFSVDESTPPA